MKQKAIVFLYGGIIAVLCLTLITRLYKVTEPVADWHSFRQTDTASVARMYVTGGIDLLHPRYHDLSNIQSGKDNPMGWRMVELPLYQAVAAAITRAAPVISIDISLRMVSIAAAVGTAFVLMLLMLELSTPLIALLTGFVFAVLPYGVFYGRAILPETFAVFWAVLSIYLVHRAAVSSKRAGIFVLSAAVAGALAVLVKPTAGFLLLPVPYIIFRRYRFSPAMFMSVIAYGVISVVPLLLWRQWIAQYPEGIPVFEWLLNKGGIRFKGAWFQWLFAERIGKLILGYWGLIPFGIGLISPVMKKEGWVSGLLAAGGLIYLSVFAAGNVQHDYYQVILLPIISIYTAKGLAFLLTNRTFSRPASMGLAAVSMLFLVAFSWYTMRSFYWINRPEIIEAGSVAATLLPKDAKVIAPYNGDTTFLYQTERQGWPLGFDIDEKIAMGATHYVTVSPTDDDWETKTLAETYTVLVRNERFAVIDLTKPKPTVDR